MELLRKLRLSLRRNKFLTQLAQDRAIVLSCMGIALVFWLLAKLSEGYTMEKSVVFVLDIPPGLAVVKAPPANLVAEVRGTGWALLYDYLRSPKVILPRRVHQQKTLHLPYFTLLDHVERALTGQDLKVTRLNIESLTIRLEPRISRPVPIVVGQSLPYAPGYLDRHPPLVTPQEVWVSGPQSRVEALTEWRLAPLELNALKTDLKKKVKLRLPPPELVLGRREVLLHLQVEQFTEKSMFIPVQIRNNPNNIRIFPGRIKLTCRVGLSRYADLTASAFEASIDAATFQPGSEKNSLGIVITQQPPWIQDLRYFPSVVEVFVRRP